MVKRINLNDGPEQAQAKRFQALESQSPVGSSSITKPDGRLRVASKNGILAQSVAGGDAAITVQGRQSVSGQLDGSGNLDWSGPTNLNGPTSIGGDVTTSGSFTNWGQFTNNGPSLFNGESSFNGNTGISGPLWVSGNVNTTGTFTNNGPTNLNGTTKIAGAAEITGAVSLKNDLTIATGGRMVAGAVTIGATGVLSSTGTMSISGLSGISLNSTTSVGGNLSVSGTATITNLNVTNTKNFAIRHPSKPKHWLKHGSTESPVSGTEYTGVVTIGSDGASVVTLPSYFEQLNKTAGRTVQVTPVGRPFLVGAEPVTSGKFTVYGEAGRKVCWLVKAERRGADFEVEGPMTDEEDATVSSLAAQALGGDSTDGQ